MYRRILVALEHGRADESLLPHVAQLATLLGSTLLLVHVADGFAARHFDELKLAESEEIKSDRDYLERRAAALRSQGLTVDVRLAMGDPPTEILKVAEADGCDLIAMTTHGHRFLGDLVRGSTISAVRHKSQIPLLLVRAAAD
ncbi:MAG: universal stress protein [Acidobacteria bacterium]|nr:universal stress protein [Acidobacteriota bacterium]